MQAEPMIALCGMNCSECSIFIAANDPQAAERLAEEWRSWQPKAQADWFKCKGCRDDRSVCWTEDCKLYACCVEEKKLDFCYQCDGFPCADLEKWAADAPNHRKAFEWLEMMRDTAPGPQGPG